MNFAVRVSVLQGTFMQLLSACGERARMMPGKSWTSRLVRVGVRFTIMVRVRIGRVRVKVRVKVRIRDRVRGICFVLGF